MTRARLVSTRRVVDVDLKGACVAPNTLGVIATEDGHALVRTLDVAERRLIAPTETLAWVRPATLADEQAHAACDRIGDDVLRAAVQLLRRHRLPIKLVHAHVPLDRSRVVVYYSSEERVDARRFARDLAGSAPARLELRTIGVREGAGIVGGLGPCGNDLCCSSFLTSFESISIRFAKDQGLALTPQRVTGMCGRLKCCLIYEQSSYKEAKGYAPKRRMGVYTAAGPGNILDVDTLNRKVLVRVGDGGMKLLHIRDVVVLDRTLTFEELDANTMTREEAVLSARRRRRGNTETSAMSREAASVLSEEYIWDDAGAESTDPGVVADVAAAPNGADAPALGDAAPAKKKRRRRKKKRDGTQGDLVAGSGGTDTDGPGGHDDEDGDDDDAVEVGEAAASAAEHSARPASRPQHATEGRVVHPPASPAASRAEVPARDDAAEDDADDADDADGPADEAGATDGSGGAPSKRRRRRRRGKGGGPQGGGPQGGGAPSGGGAAPA